MIETRLGIPISLVMLYVIVGRRANMQIDGINLPGHFIARYERILFDPFHQGRILSRPDCEAILARQRLKTQSSYFAPASPRLVLMRMLANLLFIFERSGETAEAHARHELVEGAGSRVTPVSRGALTPAREELFESILTRPSRGYLPRRRRSRDKRSGRRRSLHRREFRAAISLGGRLR